jgi:hypothetical protein
MFKMPRIERFEIALNVNMLTMNAYNKMNFNYIIQIEWGIKRLKCKWKCQMKRFDATKPKYIYFFKQQLS